MRAATATATRRMREYVNIAGSSSATGGTETGTRSSDAHRGLVAVTKREAGSGCNPLLEDLQEQESEYSSAHSGAAARRIQVGQDYIVTFGVGMQGQAWGHQAGKPRITKSTGRKSMMKLTPRRRNRRDRMWTRKTSELKVEKGFGDVMPKWMWTRKKSALKVEKGFGDVMPRRQFLA